MINIIVRDGELVCGKCGLAGHFEHKRTFRSKALVGVGSLLTAKKLKCLGCGTYNKTGASTTPPPRQAPPAGPSKGLQAIIDRGNARIEELKQER